MRFTVVLLQSLLFFVTAYQVVADPVAQRPDDDDEDDEDDSPQVRPFPSRIPAQLPGSGGSWLNPFNIGGSAPGRAQQQQPQQGRAKTTSSNRGILAPPKTTSKIQTPTRTPPPWITSQAADEPLKKGDPSPILGQTVTVTSVAYSTLVQTVTAKGAIPPPSTVTVKGLAPPPSTVTVSSVVVSTIPASTVTFSTAGPARTISVSIPGPTQYSTQTVFNTAYPEPAVQTSWLTEVVTAIPSTLYYTYPRETITILKSITQSPLTVTATAPAITSILTASPLTVTRTQIVSAITLSKSTPSTVTLKLTETAFFTYEQATTTVVSTVTVGSDHASGEVPNAAASQPLAPANGAPLAPAAETPAPDAGAAGSRSRPCRTQCNTQATGYRLPVQASPDPAAYAPQSRQTSTTESPEEAGNKPQRGQYLPRPDSSGQEASEFDASNLQSSEPEQAEDAGEAGPHRAPAAPARTQSLWLDGSGVTRTQVPKPKPTLYVDLENDSEASFSNNAVSVGTSEAVPPAVPQPVPEAAPAVPQPTTKAASKAKSGSRSNGWLFGGWGGETAQVRKNIPAKFAARPVVSS